VERTAAAKWEPLLESIWGQRRLILWAVAIGVCSGAAAVLFRYLSVFLPSKVWQHDPNILHAVADSPKWFRVLIPACGGFLAALVLHFGVRWAGAARGWEILEAVVIRDGVLHTRPAVVRSLSSLITVASGGAVGREGPMVLLSATVASYLGRKRGVGTRHLRVLVGCGVAAGIACAYNTPIGAALFTLEIILGTFALETFAPIVFSAVVATLFSRVVFGSEPLFPVAMLGMRHTWEVLLFLVLGILGGVVAAILLQSLRIAALLFRKLRLPRVVAMTLTGLMLGGVFLAFPEVAGNGREGIRDLFEHEWSGWYALALLGLRIVLTPAMVGSGAVGGVFTPTLFIGAALGESLGRFFGYLLPTTLAGVKSYAVVGMGCLLAGTTHAPITTILMMFEMTLDYSIVLPLLPAAAIASLVARGLSGDSVYTEALRRKRGGVSMAEAALSALKVREIMREDQVTVRAGMSLPQLLDRFVASRRNHVYVVDDDGRLAGVVNLHDLNRALQDSEDPTHSTVEDIWNPAFEVVTPTETLDRVLERFWVVEAERLPVVDDRESRRLLGTVSRRDILGVYNVEVLRRRSLFAHFEDEEREPTFVELPADHRIDDIPVPPSLVGTSVAELRFRERFGVSILLIRRPAADGREVRIVPEAGTQLQAGDRLVVFGTRERLRDLRSES
jgi:chloride channel protein, CIC family